VKTCFSVAPLYTVSTLEYKTLPVPVTSYQTDPHTSLLIWLSTDRPHVMAQLRPRSSSHIAPHNLYSFTAPSLKDLPTTTPGSADLPSKVSPHMTPPPPLTSSRPLPPPSSQTPHRRARSITPPAQSNGPLNSGLAIPPHQTWQTIKKRKRTHLTPVTSQLGASSSSTSRNRFDELSHLSDDDIHKLDKDLPATGGTSRTQRSRKHKPPPIYVYGVTNYQDMVSYLSHLKRSNTTAKHYRTK